MRIVGLEPTRRGHRNLNPTRLPIPSYPHVWVIFYHGSYPLSIKVFASLPAQAGQIVQIISLILLTIRKGACKIDSVWCTLPQYLRFAFHDNRRYAGGKRFYAHSGVLLDDLPGTARFVFVHK